MTWAEGHLGPVFMLDPSPADTYAALRRPMGFLLFSALDKEKGAIQTEARIGPGTELPGGVLLETRS